MGGPRLTPRQREIMITKICDEKASLADVDTALRNEGFPSMNPRSYKIVTDSYCPKFAANPSLIKIHINDPLLMNEL